MNAPNARPTTGAIPCLSMLLPPARPAIAPAITKNSLNPSTKIMLDGLVLQLPCLGHTYFSYAIVGTYRPHVDPRFVEGWPDSLTPRTQPPGHSLQITNSALTTT